MTLPDFLARAYADLGHEAMRRCTLSELFDSMEIADRAKALVRKDRK